MTDSAIFMQIALRRVDDFERKYGKKTLHLACHAALPVVLNADFLHLLRINFFLDPPNDLYYTAESDLLLSSLCHEIGDSLYEIESDIRAVLLQMLAREFKQERIRDIATLLWQYNERFLPWSSHHNLERAQQLTALNFLAPLNARQWLDTVESDAGQVSVVEREWFVAMAKEIEQRTKNVSMLPHINDSIEIEQDISTQELESSVLSASGNDRAALLTKAAMDLDILDSHLGTSGSTTLETPEGALVRDLMDDKVEFGFPNVYNITAKDFLTNNLKVPIKFERLTQAYNFYWLHFPIALFSKQNWQFNRLEVSIDFNPDQPDQYLRPTAYQILPEKQFQTLIETSARLQIYIDENFEFSVRVAPVKQGGDSSPSQIDLDPSVDAKRAGELGKVLGPFIYRLNKAKIDHTPIGMAMIRWRIDGEEFLQDSLPPFIVIARIPKETKELKVAARIQAYRRFDLAGARLQQAVKELPRVLREFFTGGTPLYSETAWDLTPILLDLSSDTTEVADLPFGLDKIRATDFGTYDRQELTNLLWKCQNMSRRESRMRIINDLPEQIRISRIGDAQNDIHDIRGVVDACLNYSGGLKELMSILSAYENHSDQLHDVENYLGNFLQKKHIVAPNPEAEKQIVAVQPTKGGVSTVDSGGLVLTHVNVYLVYWGSAWAQNPVPSADDITDSVKKIMAGPYMSALAQYRNVGNGTLYGTILVSTSEPPKTFSNDDVSNFLKDLIHMQTVPGPNDVDQLLYCVIMPVGVSSDQSNMIGEHFSPGEDILCAWVMNDGTLDSVTTIFSHELVGACTNPHGDGYQLDAPGQCSASPINWCEIGDVCEGIRDIVNGVVVQQYWSARDSACIAPRSNLTN